MKGIKQSLESSKRLEKQNIITPTLTDIPLSPTTYSVVSVGGQ